MTTARTVLRLALAAAVALVAATPARAQDENLDPSKLVTPPLHRVQVPKPERYVMPNGMIVFLLENHDLPVVKGTAYLKSSPEWVPAEKAGLGYLTGQVMRSGGTAGHPGDWLDDRLAAIGASIGTGVDPDQANGDFHCLAENASEVIALFAEVLRAPAFPEDKIELCKVDLRQAIASRNDEMFNLLARVAMEAVFGKDNPYARKPEYATVEAITRADCQRLHARVFQPNRMVLAVYGDFKPADMKKMLAARFGDWKRGDGAPVPPPPMPKETRQRIVFAPKDDVTQTGVVLSQISFRFDDPDYPAMSLLESVLGAGDQSRLYKHIRTERGLAYATGAFTGPEYIRPGVFIAYSLTRNDSALTALGMLRDETLRVTREPVSEAELETARESALNRLVFQLAEPATVLFRSAVYEVNGYPPDFLDRYQKGLEGVTTAGMLQAAQRKLHPEQLVTILVGKEKEFEQPLESLGQPVERVDITIPPPPSKLAVGAASPEALAQGQAWLKKAADLAGGSAAWASIKSVTMQRDETITMQGQSMGMSSTLMWRLPDRMVAIRKLPMGEIKQGFDGTSGWMAAMGQVKDEPKAAEELKLQYERSMFRMFAEPGSYEVQAMEPRTVDGVAYNVAFVKSETTKDWLLYFAPGGALARMEYVGEGMGGGPARLVETYGEWMPVGNIKYPHAETTLMDDKPVLEAKLTNLNLNPELADELFKKPGQ